jgi:DNA-binding XRE family transcriptional regulator
VIFFRLAKNPIKPKIFDGKAMQQRFLLKQQPTTFGAILKQWRDRRSFSQLELALTSQVSQRHISFLESGVRSLVGK